MRCHGARWQVARANRGGRRPESRVEADLSGDMALRIEKAFGVKMDTLMRMQSSYDIAQTRARARQISVKRYVSKQRHSHAPALL